MLFNYFKKSHSFSFLDECIAPIWFIAWLETSFISMVQSLFSSHSLFFSHGSNAGPIMFALSLRLFKLHPWLLAWVLGLERKNFKEKKYSNKNMLFNKECFILTLKKQPQPALSQSSFSRDRRLSNSNQSFSRDQMCKIDAIEYFFYFPQKVLTFLNTNLLLWVKIVFSP